MQWINMKKKQFIVVKTFKRKGLGKWFGHFWLFKEFLEVVPCGITQGWVCPSTWPHETQRNIYIIVSILACFDESMAKNDSCYEDVSAKGTHLTTKMIAHARVDKLPLSSFT
jgi:hypothetical protein